MRVGSLFAGYGGIELGLAMIWPDAKPAWFVEFDKHPSTILAAHYPDVPNYGDITAVDWAQVEPVDVLTGGFPCQDVSHAGLRKGVRPGTRSGLWSHMAYAIQQLQPRLVVIENVSGLLSASAAGDVEPCPWCVGDDTASLMRALGTLLADLAEIGFDAEWTSVRASDVGAPHRRERVFIVAAPHASRERFDWSGGAGQGWRAELTDCGHEPVALLPTPRATDGDKGGPNQTNGRGVRDSLPGVVPLLPTPTSRDGKGPNPNARTGGVDLPTAIERGTSHAPDDQAGTREALRDVRGSTTPQEGVRDGQRPARTPHRQEPREQRPGQPDDAALVMSPEAALAGGPRQADEGRGEGVCDGCSAWGPYASAIHRWEVRLGRLAPPPTELNKDGRYRLSPLAVEWMMGLPDGWVTGTGIPRNAQLKALGNGVVPQQVAYALTVLLPRLEQP